MFERNNSVIVVFLVKVNSECMGPYSEHEV